MKNNIKILAILLSGCCLAFISPNQDAKKDLVKLNEVYARAESWSMKIEVKMYAKASDQKPGQVQNGFVRRSGSLYYSDMMGRITLANNHCVIIVDKSEKLILYAPVEKREKQPQGIMLPDSSALAAVNAVYISSSNPAQKRIRIPDSSGEYEKTELAINKNTGILEEVTYYYVSSNDEEAAFEKITILYSEVKLNANIKSSEFSENRFITKNGNKIIPAQDYAGFEVIDQTLKK